MQTTSTMLTHSSSIPNWSKDIRTPSSTAATVQQVHSGLAHLQYATHQAALNHPPPIIPLSEQPPLKQSRTLYESSASSTQLPAAPSMFPSYSWHPTQTNAASPMQHSPHSATPTYKPFTASPTSAFASPSNGITVSTPPSSSNSPKTSGISSSPPQPMTQPTGAYMSTPMPVSTHYVYNPSAYPQTSHTTYIGYESYTSYSSVPVSAPNSVTTTAHPVTLNAKVPSQIPSSTQPYPMTPAHSMPGQMDGHHQPSYYNVHTMPNLNNMNMNMGGVTMSPMSAHHAHTIQSHHQLSHMATPGLLQPVSPSMVGTLNFSCHQCHTTYDELSLIFCTTQAHAARKRRCRKKYCHTCLNRYYGHKVKQLLSSPIALSTWHCPACLNTCTCVRCRKEREGADHSATVAANSNSTQCTAGTSTCTAILTDAKSPCTYASGTPTSAMMKLPPSLAASTAADAIPLNAPKDVVAPSPSTSILSMNKCKVEDSPLPVKLELPNVVTAPNNALECYLDVNLDDCDRSVYILRGLPGTGKSFMAQRLKHLAEKKFSSVASPFEICSADSFFVNTKTGEYQYDGAQIGEAHSHCLKKYIQALQDHTSVIVVDNTNCSKWEYNNYELLATSFKYQVKILQMELPADQVRLAQCHARQSHCVPWEIELNMWSRFEKDERAKLIALQFAQHDDDSPPSVTSPSPAPSSASSSSAASSSSSPTSEVTPPTSQPQSPQL